MPRVERPGQGWFSPWFESVGARRLDTLAGAPPLPARFVLFVASPKPFPVGALGVSLPTGPRFCFATGRLPFYTGHESLPGRGEGIMKRTAKPLLVAALLCLPSS